MNTIDNYDVCNQDYYKMTLYLAGSALKTKIPLKAVQEDIEDLLNPLFNRDKIGDRPIMNVRIDKEENSYINHMMRHVIKLTKD